MAVESQESLMLVTVDCLRADHVGFLGYDRATTPFLDGLASESFVFPAAIVGGAPTYYSFPTILASRHPLALGRDQIGLAPGEPCLATVFKDSGYATAAFCAGNPYVSRRFGYDQGFDRFQDFLGADVGPLLDNAPIARRNGKWATGLNRALEAVSHRMGPLGVVYDELYFQYCQRWATPRDRSLDELRRFPAADVLVSEALAWLDSVGDRPFFLWLHFMDPHSPYYPTEAALQAMGAGETSPFHARYLNSSWNRADLGAQRLARYREEIIGLYDAGIRWVDSQMKRLVDRLKESSRWDRCILAFTADHGEEFLDHGGRYHPPNRLMEELIQVPLLVRVPESTAKPLPKTAFSLLHLAPTLLEAAGLTVPDGFQGESHWRRLQEGAPWESLAIVEAVAGCTNPFPARNRLGSRVMAVRESRFKLILYFDPRSEQLYDLERDPHEQSPIASQEEGPVRRRLLQAARDHLQRSTARRDPQARLRARLRDLQLEWGTPEKQPVAS